MNFSIPYVEKEIKEVQLDAVDNEKIEGVTLADVLMDNSSFLKDGYIIADAIGRVSGAETSESPTLSDVIVDSVGANEDEFLDYANVVVDFAYGLGASESLTDDLFSDDENVAQDALDELKDLMSDVTADGVSPFDVATSYLMADVISYALEGVEDGVSFDSVQMDNSFYKKASDAQKHIDRLKEEDPSTKAYVSRGHSTLNKGQTPGKTASAGYWIRFPIKNPGSSGEKHTFSNRDGSTRRLLTTFKKKGFNVEKGTKALKKKQAESQKG